MSTRSCSFARLLGVPLIVSCACAPAVNPPTGIVITSAKVIDGSGGPSRNATPEEVERMAVLLRTEMEAGALGLATGLEYDPGSFSAPAELVEFAKVAASFGGRYVSHIRSEDQYFWEAMNEIIEIGREASLPVHVSHIKLAMTSLSASHAGITKRGLIEAGYYGDLVLFDPESISDRSTSVEPHAVSVGIEKVWVNGQLVYDDGRRQGA